MPSAVFFTSLDPDLVALFLKHRPPDVTVRVEPPTLDVAGKVDLVRDADYLILFPSRIQDEALEAARHLKLIQLGSAGFENMNLALCAKKGIPVANNGGTNSTDVAEHTIALMLGVYRRLVELDYDVRHDRWWAMETGKITHTLCGKTIGIVGLGHIGRRVARLLAPFDTTRLYADAFPADAETERDLGVSRLPLGDLLERADIVTLHVPLNDDTRHMIGRDQLARMKSSAVLVNTCRGPVIDEPALVDALRAGRPGFAALDVLEKEPPDPASPLLELPNVLLTPHAAGITRDTWDRRGRFIFENIQRVRRGEKPLAVVK